MGIINKPIVTVNKLGASMPAGLNPQKLLIVGQKIASGVAVSGQLYQSVAEADIVTKFGTKSMLGAQLRAVFKVFRDSGSLKLPQVDVIPLDDERDCNPTGNITVDETPGATNEATVAGVIKIIIGSKTNHTYEIPVTVGQTILSGAGSVGQAIEDAINDDLYTLVEATNTAGSIDLEFAHEGSVGNRTTIKLEGMDYNGVDYVLGNVRIVITGFGGGVVDPTVTTTLNICGRNRYQTITAPQQYGTNCSWLTTFLDARWNVTNAILDGVAIVKDTDTYANTLIQLALLNSRSLVYICDEVVADDLYIGSAIIEYDFVTSAIVAALRALRLTEGSNISRITPASDSASKDATGGMEIATLPYFNTPLYDIGLLDSDKGFDDVTEAPNVEAAGGVVIGNNIVGNTVLLGAVLTTYKTDVAGNPDLSYKYLNYVDAISVGAEYQYNNIKKDFVQHRLTQGNLKKGRAMVNVDKFNSMMIKYFCDLQDKVIAPSGDDAIAFYKANLESVADYVNGKITSDNQLPIVVQVRDILVNTKMSFNI